MTHHNIFKELPSRTTFHSAVLTTFSIDFYFLEQRVVSALRKRGIRNISVVADTRIMEDCISDMGRNIKNASSLYTINTILCNGAFHPKIHFYIGDNALMCIVGSGNLSSGGNGKNHEIFTSLYADAANKDQLALLLEVWRYLKSVTKDFKGISADQLMWMENHCNLLYNQPLTEARDLLSLGDMKVAFFTNENEPLISRLNKIVTTPGAVSKITIASPYFDEQGKVLTELLALYPNATIDVIIQPTLGLLPLKYLQNPKVTFYDLKDLKIESVRSKFLHGKIFHFQLDDEEILVLGSANATDRGFLKSSKSNMETVVAYVGKQKGWLSDLGLSGVKTKVDLATIANPLKHITSATPHFKLLFKILAADLRSTRCKLYMSTPVPSGLKLALFNNEGEILFCSQELPAGKDAIEISLLNDISINEVLFAACLDTRNNIVSNRQVVNNEQAIWSNNPSPENRKISQLLDRIASGDYSELDLFEYYDIIMGEAANSTSHSQANRITNEKAEDKQVSYAEAKELAIEHNQTNASPEEFTLRILSTYIDNIRSQIQMREEENMDDEEDGNIADGRQREDSEKNNKIFPSKSNFDTVKKRIVRYFEKYADKLTNIEVDEYQVTQSDYAFFILSISHLVALSNKSYNYRTKEKAREEAEIMMPVDGAAHEYTSFHSIAISIIGKFLSYIQYSDGEKEYQNIFDKDRLDNLKTLSVGLIALSLSMIQQKCTFNKAKFQKWHALIMLNLIDVFGQEKIDFKLVLMSQLQLFDLNEVSLVDNAKYLQDLHTRSLALYESIKSEGIRESMRRYRLVYIEYFGFCYVERGIPNLNSPKSIEISNLGFDYWEEEYIFDKIYHIESAQFLQSKQRLED